MINEKALMRQMRVSYKGGGYRVGLVMECGQEWLAVLGAAWLVTMPYVEVSKELKAQIVIHTGIMPGKAVKVQKATGVQTEIGGDLEKTVHSAFAGQKDWKNCRETCLWLGEQRVWQAEDGRCSLFSPELTSVVLEDAEDPMERLTDGQRLILDSGDGKAFVLSKKASGEWDAILSFLGQYDWTGAAEPREDDMDQQSIGEL